MKYVIQYEDGDCQHLNNVTTQSLADMSVIDAVYELYTQLYVQDYQKEVFKRKWHAAIVAGNTDAVYTIEGTSKEVFICDAVIHGEAKLQLYVVLDNDKIFFIHPSKPLWVKKKHTNTYQSRGAKVTP